MLTKMRKGADSLFVKILLGLIAFSFVGVGAASFLQGNSRGDVVTFAHTDSISTEAFLIAKSQEIEAIQRDNGINLTEQQINELGIDKTVLDRLISDAMIAYLAKHYDFDVSEHTIIDFVKNEPSFKDGKGNFDLNLFKQAFRNSKQQEEAYLQNIKKNIITGVMLDTFLNSFKPAKIVTQNVVNYMAESRNFDLFYINLDHKPSDFKAPEASEEELKQFYQDNSSVFIVPELRDFDYIKTTRKLLEKNLTITEQELTTYFDENKDEFEGQSFAQAKAKVQEIVKSNKMDDLMIELSKNLEKDIAEGLTLEEIASKYELQITKLEMQNKDAMAASDNNDLLQLADQIFEMTEGEISYPIELQDQNEIIVVLLKSVQPSKQLAFEEVREKITPLLQQKNLMITNFSSMVEVQANFDYKNIASLKSKAIGVSSNKSLARIDLSTEEKLSPALVKAIFQTAKGAVTPVIRDGNKAYFAYIKNIKTDAAKANKVQSVNHSNLIMTIKEGIAQEIIDHLTAKNKMKISL